MARELMDELTVLMHDGGVEFARGEFDFGFRIGVAIRIERAGLYFGVTPRRKLAAAARSTGRDYDALTDYLCRILKRQMKRQIRKRSLGA